MQIMFNADCVPVLYQIQGKAFNFPDLTSRLCPRCGADYLKKHGFYERYLITVGFKGEIVIRRYCCHNCGRTVSLLPSFCHPLRAYGILAIFGILSEFYIKGHTACLAVKNFLAATGAECSRQLLLHYRQRVKKNFNNLVMAIIDIYTLRAPPVTEKVNTREKVRQALSFIQSPADDSLKIFERTRTTYLTPQPI